ncbi:hypothetical protein LCGC14_1907390, partial [marine sediment metagenome]
VPMRFYASEYNFINGNVGIGTVTPGEIFHVYKAGSVALKVESSGNGNPSGLLISRERQSGQNVNAAGIYVDSKTANDHPQLVFQLDSLISFGDIGTARMVIGDGAGNDGYVGIGTVTPSYLLSIASGANEMGFSYSGVVAQWQNKAGADYKIITDFGTNTNTNFGIFGKGTGRGELRVFDQDNAEYVRFAVSNGIGFLDIQGTTPGFLKIQDAAQANIRLFSGSVEGKTRELQIYGFRTGDVKRVLEIGVGVDAADTASFDGVSNYYFDGNVGIKVVDPHSALEVNGAISSGVLTITASASGDNLNVSGINTLFINPAAAVTISGFTGGVRGQELRVLCEDNDQDVTILHAEGNCTQDILLHRGADETIDSHYGGWNFVCNGSDWIDESHAKHV